VGVALQLRLRRWGAVMTRGRQTILLTIALLLASSILSVDAQVLAIQQTQDDLLALVNRTVPEFGGLYFSADQSHVNVWVTDGKYSSALRARAAVLQLIPSPSLASARVVAHRARFTFSLLKLWQDKVTSRVFAIPGVTMNDIDDARNALMIGVEDVRVIEPVVRATLKQLGVPQVAATVDQVEPVHDMSLRTSNRPLVGGIEIERQLSLTTVAICTLGFIAQRGSVWGFVTNAHCTTSISNVNNDVFGQQTPQERVGHETADPQEFIGSPCPSGNSCRYADSAFIASDITVLSLGRGQIAHPSSGVTWNGVDKYRITGEQGTLVNDLVFKVGRTTGQTSGLVTHSCANYFETGSSFLFLCQAESDGLAVSAGDSGSPVTGPGTSDVFLKGLLWGGSGGNHGVWSLIANIQRPIDLGALTDCASGFNC